MRELGGRKDAANEVCMQRFGDGLRGQVAFSGSVRLFSDCLRSPGVSDGWSSDMDHLAGLDFFHRQKQFFLQHPVVGKLVLGNMDDDDANLELWDVLLKFHPAVDGDQHVKFLFGQREQRAVFEGVPALVMHRVAFMIAEEELDAGIYALVNEDAHSRIWLLAKSSTVRTCWRVMEG